MSSGQSEQSGSTNLSIQAAYNSHTKYVPLQRATGQIHLRSIHVKQKKLPGILLKVAGGRSTWNMMTYESTQHWHYFPLKTLKTSSRYILVSRCFQSTMKQSPQLPLLVATSPGLLSYACRKGTQSVLLSSGPGNACRHSSPWCVPPCARISFHSFQRREHIWCLNRTNDTTDKIHWTIHFIHFSFTPANPDSLGKGGHQ